MSGSVSSYVYDKVVHNFRSLVYVSDNADR